MILHLMRRTLPEPLAMLACAFVTYTTFGAPQIVLFVGAPFLLLMWTAVAHRASALEATLPIRGRDIVAARLLWQLALLAPPVLAYLFATLSGVPRAIPLNRVLDVTLITILAILVPYALRPREIDEPPILLTVGTWLVLGAASAAVIYLLPADLALDTLLIATAIATRVIWVRIPDSLETAPRKAATVAPARLVMSESKIKRTLSTAAWRPMLDAYLDRSTGSLLSVATFYLLAFVYGAMGPGHAEPFMLIYFIVPLSHLRRATANLAVFPLSNRTRLWFLLVPSIVFGFVLFTLGRSVGQRFTHYVNPLAAWAPSNSANAIGPTVPLEFWTRSVTDTPPIVTSPWGETTAADTLSIFREVFFNPYTARSTNSDRFAEWQFGRATQAVFGRSIESQSYKQAMSARRLPSTVVETPRMRVLVAAVFLAGALLGLLLNEPSHSYRRLIRNRWWTTVGVVAGILFIAMTFGDLILLGRGTGGVIAPMCLRALLYLSKILPSNIAVLSMIAFLPVLAVYLLPGTSVQQNGDDGVSQRVEMDPPADAANFCVPGFVIAQTTLEKLI